MYLQAEWEPRPTTPIRAGGYSFGARFKKEGCEGIDSSPEALLPTQAVLKSNTLRYINVE